MSTESIGRFEETKLSNIFNRELQDWAIKMPHNLLIGDFLFNNKEICKLEEVNDYWKDKKMDDFCFSIVHEKNNGQEEVDPKLKKELVNPERKKELYEALKNYTSHKITEFKIKEEQGVSKDKLITERDRILGFVRAREALKDKGVKIMTQRRGQMSKKSGTQK